MIEKLDRKLRRERYSGFTISEPVSIGETQEKINELVDAVNELQKQIDKVSCAILDLATPDGENKALKSIQVEPADPYAEQRKWIGKLCKFWDNNENIYYGLLTEINDINPYCYEYNHKLCYKHCKPVKPDDDIIYKGGDNE